MRDAMLHPITGPASTDTLAASGGLELPAHEPHHTQTHSVPDVIEEPIPGERDPSTLTRRLPGAIGGRFSGADTPPSAPDALMDEATKHDRKIEGGGGR
jgi:hypothetical protein